jgi:phosphatidylinositol kinase/protein kinase (PI-3  family)
MVYAYDRNLVEYTQLESSIMIFIYALVNIVLLNEFPHSRIDAKFISGKVIKILQNGNVEIKLFLYSTLLLYLFIYNVILSITRSKFKSYQYCNIITRFPVVGKGINLFLSLIRSAVLEKKYDA